MSWLLVGEVRGIINRGPDAPGNRYQVQILAQETMKNGEVRESIYTLGTDQPDRFHPFVGQKIMVEASPWAKKDGGLGISMAPGARVSLADLILDTRA